MDTFYNTFLLSLSLFVVIVSLSFCFALFKYFKPDIDGKLPPGTRGWRMIRETLELMACMKGVHPEKFFFDRMTKFSHHVFTTSLMLEDTAVFCGREGNKFLFSNEKKLVKHWTPPTIKKIIPFLDKIKEKPMIVRNYFRHEAQQQFVGIMDMVAKKHFETEWEGKDQIVTHTLTKKLIFSFACKMFLGIDEPERVKYLFDSVEKVFAGFASIPIDLPGTPLRRAINASNLIRKQLTPLINKRKTDLADGKASPMQDILLQALCDNNWKFLADDEFVGLIFGLMFSSQGTTSSTCTFIVKYLAELPEIYEAVYNEQMEIAKSKTSTQPLSRDDVLKMKYSWNVACEVLRLVPPGPGSFRETIKDFTYKGYLIPKGWKLFWSTSTTHKNPDFFPEPEKFDPSRFDGKGPTPYTFVPFGGGSLLCVGKEYARIAILVFMHHLVTRFKFKKVIPYEKINFFPPPTPTFARGLPVHLYPHKA